MEISFFRGDQYDPPSVKFSVRAQHPQTGWYPALFDVISCLFVDFLGSSTALHPAPRLLAQSEVEISIDSHGPGQFFTHIPRAHRERLALLLLVLQTIVKTAYVKRTAIGDSETADWKTIISDAIPDAN